MADFLSHLGVGLVLSAHVESPEMKVIVIAASGLPDLGELALWEYAAKTKHRLFDNSRSKKRRSRRLRRRGFHPIKKIGIFFQHLYSNFHTKAKIPKSVFFLYNILHSIFLPIFIFLAGFLIATGSNQKYFYAFAFALFTHHLIDYWTHSGKWSVRFLWPLLPDFKIKVPGQCDWWKWKYAKLVPLLIVVLTSSYFTLSFIYPKQFLIFF